MVGHGAVRERRFNGQPIHGRNRNYLRANDPTLVVFAVLGESSPSTSKTSTSRSSLRTQLLPSPDVQMKSFVKNIPHSTEQPQFSLLMKLLAPSKGNFASVQD